MLHLGQFGIEELLFFWAVVLGASVGSFLNVVIYRLPNGFRLALPSRSACMKCGLKLRWHDNIPILSYVFLRGRCAGCRKSFSFRYPLVEIMTAVMFLAVARYFGVTVATLYYWAFVSALIAITFIDLDHRIIPDAISFPGIAFGFLFSFFVPHLGMVSSFWGVVAGGGSFWLLAWAYEKYTGREGLGFGDVKMLAMIGAFLGPKGVIGAIVISSMLGSVVGLIIMLVQRKDLKLSVPYGPFLAIGALTYLFWGDYLGLRFYSV